MHVYEACNGSKDAVLWHTLQHCVEKFMYVIYHRYENYYSNCTRSNGNFMVEVP